MKVLVGVLYSLLPEILLLSVALLLAGPAAGFPPAGRLSAELTAGAILLAALGLSMQFNRSRLFFGLLALLLAYGGTLWLAQAGQALTRWILAGSLSLWLPLDLVLFSRISERGIFSRYGALWFGLLAGQVLFTLGVAGAGAAQLGSALHVQFTHFRAFNDARITQPGLLLFGIGLLWLNDRLIRRHSTELAAFFFSLIAAALLLHAPTRAVAAIYAAAAGLAFGHAVIQESWSMAYLDELTGLPGRRALEEQMRQLGGQYVIAMVDVDHFKRFNDDYGHDVGDQVLRFVASRLQKQASSAKPFRYGGEEFSLVFNGRRIAEVQDELEKVRVDIETCRFDLRRRDRRSDDNDGTDPSQEPVLAITVSIGAAECGTHLSEPWTVLKAADKALYDAKHGGRNRVCFNPG